MAGGAVSFVGSYFYQREYLETINQEQMSFGVNLESFSAIILLSSSRRDPQIERNGNQKEVKWSAHDYHRNCFLCCTKTFKCLESEFF